MTLVQKEIKAVYMWKPPITISDMQGPCPDGFHVPLKDEWVTLCGILTNTLGLANNSTTMVTYLKMPLSGYREISTSETGGQGSSGGYWSSSFADTSYSWKLTFNSSGITPNGSSRPGMGNSIRGIKNTPITPDSSWTALYSDKIYWNSDLGLISISGDGTTRYTIADKNLGATTVYNSGDTLSEANCGKYYQRGNNYGFPFTGTVTTSSTRVNASTYGPGNYYESSTFITDDAHSWDSSNNQNLRGGVTQGSYTEGGDIKIRPTYKPRTFTITRTEKSDMSSGWTYSDDAAGLTAGDGAFDDFFGYSAVLLNTSGVETAEMKQSGGVFTGAMTTLGNITSGDNVMIKFPVRGIKMSKSGSTVTLSITDELNKDGYQYYAFQNTGDVNSNDETTSTNTLYLGSYLNYNYSSGTVLKSWSGQSPSTYLTLGNSITYSGNNGQGYTICGYYQRMYISCLYMMKYGNPNSQSVVGQGYTNGSSVQTTGGTNSITNATGATSTSNTGRIKLFGLEDRWGNQRERVGGIYIGSSRYTYVALHDFTASTSSQSQYKGIGTLNSSTGYDISSIKGSNNRLFAPASTQYSSSHSNYYCDEYYLYDSYRFVSMGGGYNDGGTAGIFHFSCGATSTDTYAFLGSRLMYL